MRQIKFRGQADTLDNRWVYGSYVTRLNSRSGREHLIVEENGNEFHVIPETVSQSTGLHDKNGKEIYEGDIVRCAYTPNSAVVGQVVFEPTHGYGVRDSKNDWQGQLGSKHTIEVIGNIHQNPELLK